MTKLVTSVDEVLLVENIEVLDVLAGRDRGKERPDLKNGIGPRNKVEETRSARVARAESAFAHAEGHEVGAEVVVR